MIRSLFPAALVLASALGCATAPKVPTVQPPSAQTAVFKHPPALTRRTLVRGILAHNVKLVLSEAGEAHKTASGVVIARDMTAEGPVSYVVTNAHAVDLTGLHAPSLEVFVEDSGEERSYRAEPIAVGTVPQMDLALVRVKGLRLEPAQLADDDELEPGESVVVAAAPYGKSISLSGGMVSQVELDRQSHVPSMLKTDAPIGYGASGGGIYSLSTGRLLAIVEGYRTAKVGFAVAEQNYTFDVPMPGETFAAPTSKVRGFLRAKGYERLLSVPGMASAVTWNGDAAGDPAMPSHGG